MRSFTVKSAAFILGAFIVGCILAGTPARAQTNACLVGDTNGDGKITLTDFEVWRRIFIGGTISSTPGASATTAPTNPPTAAGPGLVISHDDLMARPTSGSAWDKLNAAAKSDWGSPCLYDNNCMHDVNTLAGALVAARTNDDAMKTKTINAINAAVNQNAQLARALELCRGLQTYIYAADILNYHTSQLDTNIKFLLNANIQGHTGNGVMGTATESSNNWGGHCRATVAAAGVYMNDADLKNKVVAAYNDFIGVKKANLVYETTTWHADSANKAGVNRKGAVINGVHVSGVLPEDWRRGADYKWLPTTSGYMWEGMQGYIMTAVILDRAGLVPITSGDNALVRSFDMLYGTGEAAQNSPVFKNPPTGDDTWIPWVVNYYAGTSYPTEPAAAGKNMAWTDWLFAK